MRHCIYQSKLPLSWLPFRISQVSFKENKSREINTRVHHVINNKTSQYHNITTSSTITNKQSHNEEIYYSFQFIHSSIPPSSYYLTLSNLLRRSLLSMLVKGMFGVRAQTLLCLIARLLSTFLGSCALRIDVVGSLACLRTGLALGVGGLAAGVWCGHFGCVCVCVCVWVVFGWFERRL